MVRTVDPARHADKRQAILAAAVRCFVRHGFQGASIAGICAEAGMSAGHLYHYFPSKDAIVAAIVEANLERAAERFEQAAVAGIPVLDVLVAQLEDAARDDGSRTPLLFDMLAEAGRSPAAGRMLRDHSSRMQALMIDLLKRGLDRGEIDPDLDPKAVAPVLASLIDGAKSLAVRNPDRSSVDEGNVLRLLISRFLSPPKPA